MKKLRKIPENHQMTTLFELLGTCGSCGPCGCEVPSTACGGAGSGSNFNYQYTMKSEISASYRNSYGT